MKVFQLIIFLLFFLYNNSVAQDEITQHILSKYSFGDSISWINPNFDDSNWQILYDPFIYAEDSTITLRSKIYLDVATIENDDLVLLLNIIGTYKVYWNGNYIGKNYDGKFLLRDAPGIFDQSIELSQKNNIKEINDLTIVCKIAPGDEFLFETIRIFTKSENLKTNIYLYGFLVTQIIMHTLFLFLFNYKFRLDRKYLRYFLSLITISMIFSFVNEFFLFSGIANYNISEINDLLIDIQEYLLLLSITVFLNYLYYKKPSLLHILMVSLVLLYLSYNEYSIIPKLGLIIISSSVIMSTSYRTNKLLIGATFIFLFFISVITFAWFDILIIDISFLILFYYLSMDYLIEQQRIESDLIQTKLKSSRVENEMLKKMIQPHFIMNSLNSVITVIEDSPKTAIKFLSELTEEFRLFLKFSEQKNVTILEEIELCEKHLRIMEFRQMRTFSLKTNIENGYKKIPPAILQTLIENGITHNLSSTKTICFYISEKVINSKTEITVKVDYNCRLKKDEVSENINLYKKVENSDISEGTGLKYVKSRLNENFKNDWSINFYTGENIWITKIQFT